ncbi:hypothetical protein [Peribacillus simplex]|uniref:hypothetical protein n=1 Tax=Peribacillus simplex TaxID=1478 RepID=UPI0036724598
MLRFQNPKYASSYALEWAGKALALIKKCYPSSFGRAESLYKKSHRSGGFLTQDFTALVACMEPILECDEFLADTFSQFVEEWKDKYAKRQLGIKNI